MKPEDVPAELVEKAERALVAKADADSAIEDALTDEQWDEMLDASHVVSGITREVAGRPELIVRHALAAVLPEIQAQALRDHAERRNRIQWTHSCFKPVCANCREVRLRQEERDSLLRAAARLTATTEGPTDA